MMLQPGNMWTITIFDVPDGMDLMVYERGEGPSRSEMPVDVESRPQVDNDPDDPDDPDLVDIGREMSEIGLMHFWPYLTRRLLRR